MRTLKLTAVAAVAVFAAAGSHVRAGTYDYSDSSYMPVYSAYPVVGSPCASGQCGSGYSLPSYSYAPSYAPASYTPAYSSTPTYSTYSGSAAYRAGADSTTGRCPNGCCGSCGPNGCRANGRCGTCPPGACQSGHCPANCPNGQCTPGGSRDGGTAFDGSSNRSYTRRDYNPPAPRYAPSSWSGAPATWRNYDAAPSDRFDRDRELESPFYN